MITAVYTYNESTEEEHFVAVWYLGETHQTRAADSEDVVEQ